ncbi:MAG: KpsF/GutQ family sugar-phosphate isomerase [Deltaproteobacteria bacterium]
MKKLDAVKTAKRVLRIEALAISSLVKRVGGDFARAIDLILSTEGKVIISGMGKSGIICQKIASTLSSTGTPAFFLHPAEGVHGDLGIVMKNDILIAISNSGETDEIVRLMPAVKRLGVRMIAMTGNPKSTLAGLADVSLDVGVRNEACPLGLSPTASTTACLAMGDALAVALLEGRGFRATDFAMLHPAGSLGRRLKRVDELMHTGGALPAVSVDARTKDAILEMTAKRLGITGVFKGARLVGVITDGDLRRALERGVDLLEKRASDVMTKNPKTIPGDLIAEEALKMMEEYSITQLFVRDAKGAVSGIVHMHDLLKAGVV